MLNIAFKEWASVCRALAEGRQSMIFRKGGIAETGGEFRPEYTRFWLYPTYFHAQETAIVPDAVKWAAQALTEVPPVGKLILNHYVEVQSVSHVNNFESVLACSDYHILTEATLRQRFNYRKPGLFIMPVRVHKALTPVTLTESSAYAGCKSWVELVEAVEETPSIPVVSDGDFATILTGMQSRLNAGK